MTSLDLPLKVTTSLVTPGPRLNLSSLRLIIYKARVIIFLRQELP